VSLHEPAESDQLPGAPRPVAAPSREQVLVDRRRRAGVINRRIGWLILPLVIIASFIHWGPGGYYGAHNTAVFAIQSVYVPLTITHAGLSFYVFGWVPWRPTLRVFHIWFGYAYIAFLLVSQTTFAWHDVHVILTFAMFTSLTIHVALGARIAWRRRAASSGRAISWG